jgi:hypothetical protein
VERLVSSLLPFDVVGLCPARAGARAVQRAENAATGALYGISAHGFKNLTVSIFKNRKNWSMKKLTETVLAAVARFCFH